MGVACYLSYSKVKARDSTNFYNQASNSRAVLFERSEFTGECAELPIESRKLSTAARRCRGLGVNPQVCLFFAGVSFLRQKRNAETREV